MGDKSLNIVYESAVEKLTEINSSFDKGILRVAYTGKNRNKSFISKSTFEKCIDTIYNCPIVCNYNRETDSIGAHDVEIVSTNKGMKLVNITQPVGVVPESANYWWETITEDNGETHEYLCVEILIWKRQEAYSKIKENIITDESMEIKVKSGKTVDGYYHIDSFEFTAFCLLESAEPCYESACIEMFTLNSFRDEYTKMMTEFKEHFSTVTTSQEDDINPQNITQNLSKGGSISLDRMELLSEYGLTVEALDFNIEDFSIEELRAKFEAINKKKLEDDDDEVVDGGNGEGSEGEGEDKPEVASVEDEPETPVEDVPEDGAGGGEGEGETGDDEEFSLSGEQFREGLVEALYAVKYTDPYWGEISKYIYVDYDTETSEVYCYDCEDWKLYGFSYSMNGDNVIVDFESKKRKKFTIADFDEGSADFSFKYTFDALLSSAKNVAEQKYSEASKTIENMQTELDTLRNYQKSKISEERKDAEDELFARFSDLDGIEAFEALKADCSEMALEDVESKCFEIKGRNTTVTFSANKPTSTRIAIDKNKFENEPYGGLFVQFPPKNI
ncbi:MAG: hypothetical protein IKI94_01535 [Ruminococcus sp.]|nr:hypothetical protein [Ruminococcus sp.]